MPGNLEESEKAPSSRKASSPKQAPADWATWELGKPFVTSGATAPSREVPAIGPAVKFHSTPRVDAWSEYGQSRHSDIAHSRFVSKSATSSSEPVREEVANPNPKGVSQEPGPKAEEMSQPEFQLRLDNVLTEVRSIAQKMASDNALALEQMRAASAAAVAEVKASAADVRASVAESKSNGALAVAEMKLSAESARASGDKAATQVEGMKHAQNIMLAFIGILVAVLTAVNFFPSLKGGSEALPPVTAPAAVEPPQVIAPAPATPTPVEKSAPPSSAAGKPQKDGEK